MNTSGSSKNMLEDSASVEKVFEAYSASLNTGDFDRWISLWAEDGKQYFPDAPPRLGKDQIGVAMQPLFEQYNFKEFAINCDGVRVFGDQAYAHGMYGYSVTPKEGGDTAKINGKYLTIFKQQADGSWKILIDCFNYNGPPE